MPNIIVSTTSNLVKQWRESGRPCGVVFVSTHCPFCAEARPNIVSALAPKTEILFGSILADMDFELADELNVEGVPTVVLWDDGEEVGRYEGYGEEKDYKALFAKLEPSE